MGANFRVVFQTQIHGSGIEFSESTVRLTQRCTDGHLSVCVCVCVATVPPEHQEGEKSGTTKRSSTLRVSTIYNFNRHVYIYIYILS